MTKIETVMTGNEENKVEGGGAGSFSGESMSGKPHGIGMFTSDIATWKGTFVQGFIDGIQNVRYPDGTMFIGEVSQGEFNGNMTFYAAVK